ncbi:MAG: glycosyltransferase family 2 protein [Candidatus Margulisbacteria bacterium]|nr:glycosyltransferase family 2 protein [Candidatus Margulisiibacteriota bacterium]
MSINFSVIIPTYNRWSSLKETIQSLLEQDYAAANYEIIVVDDGSFDETKQEICKLIKKNLNFKYLRQKNLGQGLARNLGAAKASREIIAFIDSDALADKEWLRKAAQQFLDNPKLIGLEGKIVKTKTKTTVWAHEFDNLTGGLYQTCNLFLRLEIFQKIKGFYPNFSGPYLFREDSDLFFSLLDAGYTTTDIPFASEVIVYHPPREDSPLAIINREKRYQWDPLLYKRHPSLYRKHIGSPLDGPANTTIISSLLIFFNLLYHNNTLALLVLLLFCLVHLFEMLKKTQGKRTTIKDLLLLYVLSFIARFIKIGYILYGNIKHKTFIWW